MTTKSTRSGGTKTSRSTTTRKTTARRTTRSTSKTSATAKASAKATTAKSATAKTTAAKPTAAKSTATKTAAPSAPKAAPAPKPKVATTKTVVTGPELRKKDLIDKVVERSGVKKRDAKPVVETMLAVLGEALAEGRELNLQPLGKVKVNRQKSGANGNAMICRVRQSSATVASHKDPLAKAAE